MLPTCFPHSPFWWKQNYGLIGLALLWTISFVYFMFLVIFFCYVCVHMNRACIQANQRPELQLWWRVLNNHVFIIQTHKIMIKNVNLNGALQDTCRFSAYLSGYCLVNPENWLGFWHPKLMPEETCWNKIELTNAKGEKRGRMTAWVTQKLSPILGPFNFIFF